MNTFSSLSGNVSDALIEISVATEAEHIPNNRHADATPKQSENRTAKRKRTQTADDLAAEEAIKYGQLGPRRRKIGRLV